MNRARRRSKRDRSVASSTDFARHAHSNAWWDGRKLGRIIQWSAAPAETAGAKRTACGSRCLAIDVAFGKGGQLAVRGLLLLQVLFEQPGAIRAPELLRPRDQRAVARHLVVLDRLGRGDQGRVED